MTKRRPWTEEDQATASRLYRENQNYKLTAEIMGRSASIVRDWLQGKRGHRRIKRTDIKANDLIVVPADRLELRERLYAAPYRDLTGYLLGDPPVGFSALDRR